MIIPQELPQFNTERALLSVSSRHKAIFYFANKGKLEKLEEIETEKPTFSDKEGMFQRGGQGRTYSMGGVHELKDDDKKSYLLKEIDQIFSKMSKNQDFETIYIFSSRHMITEVSALVPNEWKKKIKMKISKNFTNSHPLDVLQNIDEKLGKKVQKKRGGPRSLEEKKILEKARE